MIIKEDALDKDAIKYGKKGPVKVRLEVCPTSRSLEASGMVDNISLPGRTIPSAIDEIVNVLLNTYIFHSDC